MRERVHSANTWVVKVGSSLLTDGGKGLDRDIIAGWTEQLAQLMDEGKQLVLVSSGSIAEGMARLGWSKRPTQVDHLQAAAAVGQMGLIQAYESGFKQCDKHTAQILLTHEDMANRRRYLNARATLNKLLKLGVLPIVNENDTVTTDEIRLGDNDTLAALVANLIDADVLVLLTDQDGLYTKDPRHNPDATLLDKADANDQDVAAMAGPSGSSLGQGGMSTKVSAARRAATSGTTTVIASGREPDILLRLAKGEHHGTMLTSTQAPKDARKRWLANQLQVKGTLTLDSGACNVLRERGSSLLAVGVVSCKGNFQRGELVACVDDQGNEYARGLVNYPAAETRQILGLSSKRFVEVLGYQAESELVHRDNMIVSPP